MLDHVKDLASSQPRHLSTQESSSSLLSYSSHGLTENQTSSVFFTQSNSFPHYLFLYFRDLLIMKSSILLAASMLGSAMAGIHRMPLKKMPLTEQLVSESVWELPGTSADVYSLRPTAISTLK